MVLGCISAFGFRTWVIQASLRALSGLFIVRVATILRPLGTFHQQLCRHREIVTAKENIESYLLFFFSSKSTLMVLLRISAPLSQLVFNKEGILYYRAEKNSLAM